MTAPPALATGTVAWTVTGITGAAPGEATVTFVPAPTMLLASDPTPVTLLGEPVPPVELEPDGSLAPVELLATDAAGVTPTGWTWTAYLRVRGIARGSVTFTLATGAAVDLTDVAPVTMDRGTLTLRGPQGETGPAGATGPAGPPGLDGADGADAVLPDRLSEAALSSSFGTSVLRRDIVPVIGRALAVDGEVPTVTFSGSQTISGSNAFPLKRLGNVTGADADLPGDTVYAVGGTTTIIANPSSPNNRTRAAFITGGSGQAARYTPTFRFMCDAAAFEYEGGIIGNTFMYRLSVDGRRAVAGTTLATGSGYGYVKFDFGTAKPRMIDLTIVDPDFNTIRVPATYSLWRPPQGFGRRLFAIGDSMTGGASGVDRHLTWLWDVAAALGCDDVWNVGIGGTGWVADGSGTTRYSGRVTTDIAPLVQPRDVVLFFGSRNDPSGTQPQLDALTAAVTSTLNLIPAGNPNVFVAGPITAIAGNGAAVAAGAAAAGRPYIDSTGWITGTGRSGAPNGSGNADRYIGGSAGTDTIHPTAAGQTYLGRRWINGVRALLPT